MLQIETADRSTVLLSGRFDATQVQKAESVLEEIEGDCILDCRGLEYISSAGIGVILATFKRLHDRSASFKMTNVNQEIRQVFRYAGLDKIMGIDQE